MTHPIAFQISATDQPHTHTVRIDPSAAKRLKPTLGGTGGQSAPAVLVVRKAEILTDLSLGIFSPADVVSVSDGDWDNAILVVLSDGDATEPSIRPEPANSGDQAFIDEVERNAPALMDLARKTLSSIRAAQVDGNLVKTTLGRWKNEPLNTFTLKIQPRKGNIQFTLYGNPETYRAGDFLRSDQNSYSRGWVTNDADVVKLAELTRQSHARRKQ